MPFEVNPTYFGYYIGASGPRYTYVFVEQSDSTLRLAGVHSYSEKWSGRWGFHSTTLSNDYYGSKLYFLFSGDGMDPSIKNVEIGGLRFNGNTRYSVKGNNNIAGNVNMANSLYVSEDISLNSRLFIQNTNILDLIQDGPTGPQGEKANKVKRVKLVLKAKKAIKVFKVTKVILAIKVIKAPRVK